MTANLHHGLPIQRFKLTDYVIWLYENDYEEDQISDITELAEKEVRRIISKYESEDEDGGNASYAKSDGQLLLDYIVKFHKRVGDKAADVAHEMVEAMNVVSEKKQDQYVDGIHFISGVLQRIRIG